MTGVSSDMGRAPPGRNCVTCGRPIGWEANVCPYCGYDYRFRPTVAGKPRTAKPVVGGILIVVAGVLAIAMALMFIVVTPSDLEGWGYEPVPDVDVTASEVADLLQVCGVIGLMLGVVAIVGGAFAAMRRGFVLTVIGGLFGMAGIGFLIGAVLGLVGLVLVATSKDEF